MRVNVNRPVDTVSVLHTEDDDDDDDDDTTRKKLVILVAKDAKTGKYWQLFFEKKKCVNTPRHGWCLCCVDLGIAGRIAK